MSLQISPGALISNTKWLCHRLYAHKAIWQSGSGKFEISVASCRDIVEYFKFFFNSYPNTELSSATVALEKWAVVHKDANSIDKSEVARYFVLLSALLNSAESYFSKKSAILLSPTPIDKDKIDYLSLLFPELSAELQQCVKCLRAGFATAAVFHISRILEQVLRLLAKRFDITGITRTTTWQGLTDRLNAKLNAMLSKTPYQAQRKRSLSIALAHLNAVRSAWRNDVMHPGGFYSDAEARDVIQHSLPLLEACAKLLKRSVQIGAE